MGVQTVHDIIKSTAKLDKFVPQSDSFMNTYIRKTLKNYKFKVNWMQQWQNGFFKKDWRVCQSQALIF